MSMYTSNSDIAQKLRLKVTDAAYQSALKPTEYSQLIFNSCIASRGRVDKFLGVDV